MFPKISTAVTCCAILISSCSPSSVQKEPSRDTSPPTFTVTSEPSATPVLSPTMKPTSTEISPELSEAAKQSYLAMLLIQINAQLVEEAAARTFSGELSGFDQIGAVLAIAALIEGANQSLPEVSPPDSLSEHWRDMMDIHERTKEIMGSWFNDDIDSSMVIEQISSLLTEADNVLLEVENRLSEEFQFDPLELTSAREEILASLSDIFESTPLPDPGGLNRSGT